MNALTIAGRELRSLFTSPLGWLVLAGFLLITGVFWASMVSFYALEVTGQTVDPYSGYVPTFQDYLFLPFFRNSALLLIMVCPAVSMRLFAEEQKQGTLELLLTSPVSTVDIVLGKFLGALGFVAVMLLGIALAPLLLGLFGDPDYGVVASSLLGLLLVGASVVSMGMLFSAFTENQIIALVWTLAVGVALWVLSMVTSDPESVFVHLSLGLHADNFWQGLVYVSDLVYFAGFIGLFLFATWQRIESFRWG